MKQLSKGILACLLSILFVLPIIGAQKTAKEYSSRLGKVNNKIKDVKKKLAFTRHKQRVVTSQLYGTQRKLGQTREGLLVTRTRLVRAHDQLNGINADLRKSEARLLEKRTAMTQRLTEAYKHPPPSYIAALVTSEDAWSAMTCAKMIHEVVESDKRLLEDIRDTREQIKNSQAAQRRKVTEIRTIQRDLSFKESQEKQLAWQQRAQLSSIVADRVTYERALDELLEESRHVAAIIRAMQATPAGRKRMETAFRGGFIRPVSGPITSGFGMRFHPILKKRKLHTGVDISCRTGTAVHAAAAGTVIVAGWMKAYGNAVVIDHGGNVVTLYGHCSSLCVRSGQNVAQGQLIAKSGSTGWSTGPHLHFEVQRHGQPVNPF